MKLNASTKISFSIFVVLFSLGTLFTILEIFARMNDHPFGWFLQNAQNVELSEIQKYGLIVTKLNIPIPNKSFDAFNSKRSQRTFDFFTTLQSGYRVHKKSFSGLQTSRLIDSSIEVYNVKSNFDQYGRRSTTSSPKESSLHIFLVGCSFTFGEGLEDNQTLSSQLQKIDQDSSYFNLGRMGGSVVDVVVSQEATDVWEGVSPLEGVVLFNFSAVDHVPRFLGTIRTVGAWNEEGGFLKKEKHIFKFGGIYRFHRPIWTQLRKALDRSEFLRAIAFDWPPVDDAAFEEYALAIKQVKDAYLKKFESQNKFIVFFRPGEAQASRIIPYLEKYRILYLDYSKLKFSRFANKPLKIPYDGHPSAEYNRLLAMQLHNDLLKNCIYKGRNGCSTAKVQKGRDK